MEDSWYALHVRSRSELVVAAILSKKDYEVFCPTHKVRRQWTDRIRTLEFPLFAGYLFCRFNVDKRLPILVTPGVLGIVGNGRLPTAVDHAEIEAIQKVVRSGSVYEPHPYLSVGEQVRIIHGSLSGVTGIIIEAKKTYRVVLSVNLLMRSVSVEVDQSWIEPIGGIDAQGEDRSTVPPIPNRLEDRRLKYPVR